MIRYSFPEVSLKVTLLKIPQKSQWKHSKSSYFKETLEPICNLNKKVISTTGIVVEV